MPKLYFFYATMNSGKTLQAQQVAYDHRNKGLKALVLKSENDPKGGKNITSRIGLETECDFLISPDEDLYKHILQYENIGIIIVDEAQFLSRKNVEDLVKIVVYAKISVMCYGLRNDFCGKLFEGSLALFESAQKIEEIQTRTLCEINPSSGELATMNIRLVNREAIFSGDQIVIDGTENVEYAAVSLETFIKIRDGNF